MSPQPSPRPGGALLTAEQAAELLAVPVSFVRQETRADRIPYIPIGVRYKRYEADVLRAWWESRRRGPGRRGA
jgi:excisionase family DNA binding protein